MNSNDWEKIKGAFFSILEIPESDRASFLASLDPNLRGEVEKLLTNLDSAENFIEEPAFVQLGLNDGEPSDNFIGKTIDNYLILEEIGTGGMGAVYLAEQRTENLSHRVALKLIKRGMDTNSVLKRFVQERQILANLEHPNIARFLDGGSTEEGLPYFVMEYVDGLPINKYCDQNGLDLREQLELFQKVAEAVSFAHQNLIVHRDLKPSNILVSEGGEVKLLDFGIARLLNPDWSADTKDATATMFRVMTPEYASPEQLRGLPVTTSGDVYSLGVVLFEILTGKRPYKIESRSPDEVAREVLTQEPPKPSSVVSGQWPVAGGSTGRVPEQTDPNSRMQNPKSLRGDLDNIILKALQKEPERRYASVEEFSEDIRRHLAGLPVTATADTKAYRLKKFVRRHRAGVVTGGMIALVLIAATTITGWQAVVARSERDKAEQRFNEVRKLANTILFEYHDRIANLPGSTPIREKMLTDALEYLDGLSAEGSADSALQNEIALAYQKIGDIQGGRNKSNLGQREKAKESYDKSVAIMESLVASDPGNVDFRRSLAFSHMKRGDILLVETDVAGAAASYEKALAMNSQLVSEMPSDLGVQLDEAKSRVSFGYIVAAQGQGDEGLGHLRQAIFKLEDLASVRPQDIEIQRTLATAYDNVGEVLISLTDNYSEALRSFQRSQQISDTLFAAEPLDTQLRRDVAVSFIHVAQAQAKLGDNKTALENARRSLEVFSAMLAADPENAEVGQTTAAVEGIVSELLIETGSPDEAISLLDRSLVTLEKTFADSPNDQAAHFRIAIVQTALGKAYVALALKTHSQGKKLNSWLEARSWFAKSFAIYEPFRAAGKTVGDEDAKIDEVAAEINKCDAEIKRMTR